MPKKIFVTLTFIFTLSTYSGAQESAFKNNFFFGGGLGLQFGSLTLIDVSPHAGYFFSGHVAGAGYRQVQDRDYDTVVLVGPDHTGIAQGSLAVPDFDAWDSPLGRVPVDTQLVAALEKRMPLRGWRSGSGVGGGPNRRPWNRQSCSARR